jgi:hypothetical protein
VPPRHTQVQRPISGIDQKFNFAEYFKYTEDGWTPWVAAELTATSYGPMARPLSPAWLVSKSRNHSSQFVNQQKWDLSYSTVTGSETKIEK